MNRKTYEKKLRAFSYAMRMMCKDDPKSYTSDIRPNKESLVRQSSEMGGYAAMWKECKRLIGSNDPEQRFWNAVNKYMIIK